MSSLNLNLILQACFEEERPKNEFVLSRCQLKYFPTWQEEEHGTDKRIRKGMNQLVRGEGERQHFDSVARVSGSDTQHNISVARVQTFKRYCRQNYDFMKLLGPA